MTAQRSPCARKHGLDGLRFVLAAAILVYHYLFYGPNSGHVPGAAGSEHIFWLRFAVPVFFVISGFVIFYSMNGKTAGGFLFARALRLWPALAVCACVTFGAAAVSGQMQGEDVGLWLRAIALLPLAETGSYLDESLWSLTYEIRFYALIAVLMALGFARSAVWIMTALGVVWMVGCLIGASYISWLTAEYTGLFGLGMALALSEEDRRSRVWIMLGANFVVAWFGTGLVVARDDMLPSYVGGAQGAFVAGLAIVLAAGAMVKWASVVRVPVGWVTVMSALGAVSYPLYLLHQRLGYMLLEGATALGLGTGTAVVLTAALVLGLSLFVALRVEPWVRRRMKAVAMPVGPEPGAARFGSGGAQIP